MNNQNKNSLKVSNNSCDIPKKDMLDHEVKERRMLAEILSIALKLMSFEPKSLTRTLNWLSDSFSIACSRISEDYSKNHEKEIYQAYTTEELENKEQQVSSIFLNIITFK